MTVNEKPLFEMRNIFIVICAAICLFITACGGNEKADMLIYQGKIVTVDNEFSFSEAVAVKNGRIIFVGSNKDAEAFIGDSTEIIDAEGLTVLPGLIDAHAHLVSLGDELVNLEISGCRSFEEMLGKVKEKVAVSKPGEWIVGGRWDHTLWPGKSFPVHRQLSAISPDNPVYLKRVDGNSAFVNKRAMELAGITAATPDPPGGMIVKGPDGEPTGVLVNQAMNLVKTLLPGDSKEYLADKLELAVELCSENGLTGVHEAGVGPKEIDVLKEMADKGKLAVRVNAMLGEQEKPRFQVNDLNAWFKENRLESYADNMLCVKTVKLFFDGALGSRGAAFFEGYDDDPGNTGILRISPEYITEVTKAALANNMSVATHCIGIRGNSLCLDSYAEALKEYHGEDHRLRIEHAQVLKPEDIARFASLNVIPSMQPTHCSSDKNMIRDRIGKERSKYSYAWRSLLDAGLIIPAGSDFPVEAVNPFLGIYAAVTRKLPGDGPDEVFNSEQCMTVEEAIRGFTIWAAYAAFQEDILGSIETGKYADFTVIDRDITLIDPEEIPGTKVVYTILGGEIKYRDK